MAIISEKGYPDLFIPKTKKDSNGNLKCAGLFIELKKIGGKPSKEQLKMVQYLNNEGYFARIVEGAEDAIELINNYINGEIIC